MMAGKQPARSVIRFWIIAVMYLLSIASSAVPSPDLPCLCSSVASNSTHVDRSVRHLRRGTTGRASFDDLCRLLLGTQCSERPRGSRRRQRRSAFDDRLVQRFRDSRCCFSAGRTDCVSTGNRRRGRRRRRDRTPARRGALKNRDRWSPGRAPQFGRGRAVARRLLAQP